MPGHRFERGDMRASSCRKECY